MRTAIVITPAETETALRELVFAARKAGSGNVEIWRLGAELPGRAPALADTYFPALRRAVDERKPDLILFGPGVLAKALCSVLAYAVKGSCALGITDIVKTPEGLRVARRVFGLQIEAAFLYSRAPYFFSAAKDSFAPADDEALPEEVLTVVSPPKSDWYEDYAEIDEESPEGLETRDLILAGGRGLGGKAAASDLAELGRRVNAGVGATRPAALNGWMPLGCMIGLSGLTVKPKLCVAFGISGCAPFLKGVEKSECLIAVNQDPEAAIFRHCDLGLVAECNTVVRALIERAAS
jgi:electron transfer flavoprotein alpha subunit